MKADRPLLGILLMVGFCVLAPLGDSLAKLLGDTIPLLQLVATRFALQVVVLAPIIWLTSKRLRMTPRLLGLTALRTVFHIAGIGAMFLSLRYLPLAEAVAIAFVMPFILLALGWAVLGEEVGPRRLIACIVGFIGTLLVVQPTFAAVGPPALLPLVVAVVFALFMLVTRQIARQTDPIALQAVSGLMASVVLLPLLALGSVLAPLAPIAPSAADWSLLVTMGVLGTGAHLLMTWSLRFAPSATLAPMQYLEIPIATLLGWLIFGDFPNGLAALGIGITILSGLYVILRERQLAAMPAQPPTQRAAE